MIPVVVVGAGPVGIAAATLLSCRGVDCTVLERFAQPYHLPRAVHADDEVLRILQRIGVADRFADISRPTLGMRLVDRDLRVLAELRRSMSPSAHGWPEANLFDQPDLEALLRDNLRAHPSVTMRTGADVRGVGPVGVDGSTRVRLHDRATGGDSEIAARYVLGCDGANSVVRQAMHTEMRDLGFTETWLVIDVRTSLPLDLWNGVHQLCDPDAPATFMRIGHQRYRWEFRRESDSVALSDNEIRRLLAPWIDVREDGVDIVRSTSYTFRASVARTWRSGNTFLLGDAAHLTPPFIGQGLGSGLRDAADLSWKLASVLTGSAHESLLDTYDAERRPQATSVVRTAMLLGWAMAGGSMAGGSSRAARARQRVLIRALSVPGASTIVQSRPMAPPGRSELTTGRKPIGTFLPQQHSATSRSDELLGDGFAIVANGEIPPRLARLGRQLDARIVSLPDTAFRDGVLTRWLRRHRRSAVLVRPDRLVLADSTVRTDDLSWVRTNRRP